VQSPSCHLQTRTVLRLFLLILGASIALAQPSPAQNSTEIKVKAASDADNTLARAALQSALASDSSIPKELLSGAATCGPTLWASLKGSADETLLHSKVVTAMLSIPEPLQTVGRGLTSDAQRESFWKLLRAKYPALKNGAVRKASADEIRYYWSTIPFDIEEPIFAIEAGSQIFIANLKIEKKKPVLFWIDLVGDLHHLRDQTLTPDEIQEFVADAEAGLPISTYEIGRAYLLGRGVPADLEKARLWLDRAAENGSLDAQVLLGASYLSGVKLPKTPQLASKYLLQAAQQHNAPGSLRNSQAMAQYWIASMYEQGNGLEKSHEKAIQFLQLAANSGNATAQYDLAGLYNDGTGGMTKDKTHACELFDKAAAQGHVKAMHNAAYCFQVGEGGQKDENKAIDYYRRAAESGSVRSQRNLGILFGQLGQTEKAFFWLRIAESSGDTDQKSLIETTKEHLTPTQVESAEKEISAWLNAHKAKKE
jgi:TPR repeat protein